MKSFFAYLALVVMLIGTLAAGVMHNSMPNYSIDLPERSIAEKKLRGSLPEQVGNWKGKSAEIEKDVTDMLQCRAYIKGVYEHIQTGARVSVVVLLGPPGPISVHTPEVCYESQDYEVDGKTTQIEIEDVKKTKHSLWQVDIKATRSDANDQRVFYGWTTGGSWEAPNPKWARFTYGGAPYLYKIQMAGPNSRVPEGQVDPNLDFLKEFLAECQTRIIVPNADSVDSSR